MLQAMRLVDVLLHANDFLSKADAFVVAAGVRAVLRTMRFSCKVFLLVHAELCRGGSKAAVRTRTRTNTIPYGTEASAAG